MQFNLILFTGIDRKYDLFFYGGETNPGKATSFHPVDISNNEHLSVIAVVRFANKGAQGTFISLYNAK